MACANNKLLCIKLNAHCKSQLISYVLTRHRQRAYNRQLEQCGCVLYSNLCSGQIINGAACRRPLISVASIPAQEGDTEISELDITRPDKKSNMLNNKRDKSCVSVGSTMALTVACSFCERCSILSALTRTHYSRVTTAAARMTTRTRSIRRPCQQRRLQRRNQQR